MPNVRKEAYDAIVRKLENELSTIQYKIMRNKRTFKDLAKDQATLKRERGIIADLIRKIKGAKS